MDFQQLLYLVRAIENGNISQTAQELNVSQPAVSKGIKKLEEEVQSQLIERHGKGVKPTPTGDALCRHAKTILSQISRASNEIESIKDNRPATLSIGCTPSLVDAALPDVVSEFSKLWPNCSLKLRQALYPELLTALKNNELDAVIALDFHSYTEPDIDFDILGQSQISFVVNKTHPLAKMDKISTKQLSATRWVVLNSKDAISFFHGIFSSKGLTPFQPAVLSQSMNIIKSLVVSTDLVGFLPKRMVNHELESGVLVELQTDMPVREMNIVLAHNKAHFPSETLNSFLQVAESTLKFN